MHLPSHSRDIDTELFSSCFFLLYSLTVATEPPQTTSTALPSLCTGILPPILSTSMGTASLSATTDYKAGITAPTSLSQLITAIPSPLQTDTSPTNTVSPPATTGISSLQLGTTMLASISLSPSPTTSVIAQQATNQGSLETAGIAVSVTFATVTMLMAVAIIVLWRRRCRNKRQGKITRKARSSIRRLLLPRTKESPTASSLQKNLMTRPSPVLGCALICPEEQTRDRRSRVSLDGSEIVKDSIAVQLPENHRALPLEEWSTISERVGTDLAKRLLDRGAGPILAKAKEEVEST